MNLVHFSQILVIGLLVILAGSCRIKEVTSNATPIRHTEWTKLLKRHVDEQGWVDYIGFQQDSVLLNQYLQKLRTHHPNTSYWTDNERKAYWINAYNAFTIKLVSDHYPISGIKKIRPGLPFVNSVWDIKFIEIEGKTYDLNNIEHGILRERFEDPRIHFALNCASVSCPVLKREAYSADRLDQQLEEAGNTFLRDPSRNKIEPDLVQISSIFKWFRGDFVSKEQGLIDFLNRFTQVPIHSDAKIKYLDYDWNLNDQHLQKGL